MKTWNEARSQRMQLERDQEGVENAQRSARQVAESYEEYFFYQRELFEELQEEFAQSETDLLYQEMADQIRWQNREVQDCLGEQEEALKKQLREIEDRQEALSWEERDILRAEMEEKDEY